MADDQGAIRGRGNPGPDRGFVGGAARCYTWSVPTARPRHTITETPPVEEALDELRAELDGERVDFAELVTIGARAKARELRTGSAAARSARNRLAAMIRARSIPVDVDAADEAKRVGLVG